MGKWNRRVAAPGSGWRLVRTADDIVAAQADGTTGLIMGWQSILAVRLTASNASRRSMRSGCAWRS